MIRLMVLVALAVSARAESRVERFFEHVLLDHPDHKINYSRSIASSLVHVAGHYADYRSTDDFSRAGFCEGNKLFQRPDCTPNFPRIVSVKLGVLVGSQAVRWGVLRKCKRCQRPFDILAVAMGVKLMHTSLRNWRGLGVDIPPRRPAGVQFQMR